MAARRNDENALRDARTAFFIEKAHQRLASGQLGDGALDVDGGVGAHGFGGSAHGLLVTRGVGAQCMLHAVSQLRQHGIGNIDGVLRHEVNAHALGAHEPHHQFDALQQHFGRGVEQQVGLVEEEHELGFFGIAHFG